jgi:hypothetical protein
VLCSACANLKPVVVTRAADLASADGDAVGQRTRDHAEQLLVTGGTAHHQNLSRVRPERWPRAQEVTGQHRDLEP